MDITLGTNIYRKKYTRNVPVAAEYYPSGIKETTVNKEVDYENNTNVRRFYHGFIKTFSSGVSCGDSDKQAIVQLSKPVQSSHEYPI